MTVGERLLFHRTHNIMRPTQADMAKLAGIKVSTYQKWESGELSIPVDMVYLLADWLRIPPAELLPQSDETISAAPLIQDGQMSEVITIAAALSESSQNQALDFLRFLFDSERQHNQESSGDFFD